MNEAAKALGATQTVDAIRRRKAFHEAGHAVAARLHRRSVKYVELKRVEQEERGVIR